MPLDRIGALPICGFDPPCHWLLLATLAIHARAEDVAYTYHPPCVRQPWCEGAASRTRWLRSRQTLAAGALRHDRDGRDAVLR